MSTESESSSSNRGPNADICDFILDLADYERNVSRNKVKYNAYRNAAAALEDHPTRVKSKSDAVKIKGIGPKIGKRIDDYLNALPVTKWEKMQKSETVIALNNLPRVWGIGPAKAKELADLGIHNLDDLQDNKDKLNDQQLVGLKYVDEFELPIPREEIKEISVSIQMLLDTFDPKYTITVCGSYRRKAQTHSDIDIVLTHSAFDSFEDGNRPELLVDAVNLLVSNDLVTDLLTLGDTKFMGVCQLKEGWPHRRLNLRLLAVSQYYCGILYFTGSDLFNRNLRLHARRKGFFLNEYCIRRLDSKGNLGPPLPVTCEKDIFDYVDYEYKEPKDRNH